MATLGVFSSPDTGRVRKGVHDGFQTAHWDQCRLPRDPQGYPGLLYLYAGYFDAVVKAGGVPIIIPPLKDQGDLDRVLEVLDGVVLAGGADLDPRNDGFMLHPSIRLLDRRREEFDRMLVRSVAQRRMPVFGIGCGMQLLNVSQGGNLFLHIAEDVPAGPAAPGRHRPESSPRPGRRAGDR